MSYIKGLSSQQARTKDIAKGAGLGSTIYPILRQFEKDRILEVKRTRQETVYKWTRKAENIFRDLTPPEVRVSRVFYERLRNRVDLDISYEEFVRQIIPAIGITFLPALLESIQKKETIDVGMVLEDFKFLINGYIVNKRSINSSDEKLEIKQDLATTTALRQRLDAQPEQYEHQLSELRGAVEGHKETLLKEENAMPVAELAYAISKWTLAYIEKNKLAAKKKEEEETWPTFISYMVRLNELLERMDYPHRIIIPVISAASTQQPSSDEKSTEPLNQGVNK